MALHLVWLYLIASFHIVLNSDLQEGRWDKTSCALAGIVRISA